MEGDNENLVKLLEIVSGKEIHASWTIEREPKTGMNNDYHACVSTLSMTFIKLRAIITLRGAKVAARYSAQG